MAPIEHGTEGLKVLVVDDTATNRLLLQAFLKKLGCEVVLAENGERAVEMFPAGRSRCGADGRDDAGHGWLRSHAAHQGPERRPLGAGGLRFGARQGRKPGRRAGGGRRRLPGQAGQFRRPERQAAFLGAHAGLAAPRQRKPAAHRSHRRQHRRLRGHHRRAGADPVHQRRGAGDFRLRSRRTDRPERQHADARAGSERP